MLNLSIDKHIQGQTYRKLQVMDSAYHCPYDLVDNKVNAIYIYKIRDYDSTSTEHNYLFSCEMGDNHRGVCFLKDEKTMRVYGVARHPYNYMDISNFPTSYFSPCRRDKWNVVCVLYDTTSVKSSLWVSHGKIRDFACRLPLKASKLNLFNRVHFDGASGFDGYIESVEIYNYYKSIPTGLIVVRMTYLCLKSRRELMVALYEQIQECTVLSH